MAGWNPISLEELEAEINRGINAMTPLQLGLWNEIKVPPQKWRLPPWGDEGDGFWVVALMGTGVIYYNDIEDGFNSSIYDEYGLIRDYWCNQDELQWVVQRVLRSIDVGTGELTQSECDLAAHADAVRQRDLAFYGSMGPEDLSKKCRREGCERGVVAFSVLCREHHFESIFKRPSPLVD